MGSQTPPGCRLRVRDKSSAFDWVSNALERLSLDSKLGSRSLASMFCMSFRVQNVANCTVVERPFTIELL